MNTNKTTAAAQKHAPTSSTLNTRMRTGIKAGPLCLINEDGVCVRTNDKPTDDQVQR